MALRRDLNYLLYFSCIFVGTCSGNYGDNWNPLHEFVFTIPGIRSYFPDEDPRVMITTLSNDPVHATLSIPSLSWQDNVTMTRTSGADIKLPIEARMYSNENESKTIIVRSSNIVSVFAIDNDDVDGDAFQVLPSVSLGKSYHVASSPPDKISTAKFHQSILSISALHTPTSLKIKTPDGRELTVILKELESYRFDALEDLSGTIISSEEPIAVISGCLSGIPMQRVQDDGTITQLLPVDLWGMTYHMFPFITLNQEYFNGYIYRVFASNITTTLRFSDGKDIHIQPDEFFEDDSPNNMSVVSFESNHPVMVAQYMKTIAQIFHETIVGMGSMFIVPPVSSYTNNITFPTFIYNYIDTYTRPENNSVLHMFYINVVSKCDTIDDLVLNENDFKSASLWNDNLTSEDQSICCVRGEIWKSSSIPSYHSVTHPDPNAAFFVSVYALPTCKFNCFSSYAHTALGTLTPLSTSTLSTTQATTSRTSTETRFDRQTNCPATHNKTGLVYGFAAGMIIFIILFIITLSIHIKYHREIK